MQACARVGILAPYGWESGNKSKELLVTLYWGETEFAPKPTELTKPQLNRKLNTKPRLKPSRLTDTSLRSRKWGRASQMSVCGWEESESADH